MTVNELRIGNLIKQPTLGGTLTVDWMIIEIISKLGDYYAYEPIPLTEDWLLKRTEYKLHHEDSAMKIFRIDEHENVFIVFHKESGEFRSWGHPLIGIHELQNLFYAMERKELEIKQ